MSECVMLIASAKIPAGKRCDFSFATPHHPSSNDDSSTAKEQKLTKQCFLPPPPRRFST